MKRFSFLLLVLSVIYSGCSLTGTEQKLPSETADSNRAQPVVNYTLTLNHEPTGNLADLTPLKQRISHEMRMREWNGVFKVGSNEIENTVYLVADPKTSVGKIADVVLSMNANGARTYIPKSSSERVELPANYRPNPLIIWVTVGDVRSFRLPPIFFRDMYGDPQRYSFAPNIRFAADEFELKTFRFTGKSFDISADDKYFINEPEVSCPELDPDYSDLKQRAVMPEYLASESPTSCDGSSILIIASERASYASLLKVFEAVEENDLPVTIVVRRHNLDQP